MGVILFASDLKYCPTVSFQKKAELVSVANNLLQISFFLNLPSFTDLQNSEISFML